MCGNKGGKCGACGEESYCCRNYDGPDGDCPIDAKVAADADKHVCVGLSKTGLSKLADMAVDVAVDVVVDGADMGHMVADMAHMAADAAANIAADMAGALTDFF